VTDDDAAFALLSRQITTASGFALAAYKDKCIRRRIAVRMRACGVHTYQDYGALLGGSPPESERLRDALTINVTRFYRNAETWSLIRRVLLPELLGGPRGELRAWSAGCASGEEPYTLVVLAADYLDREGRGDELARVTVDATDIDRVSLERARAGCYRSEGLAELPADLAERYFEAAGPCRRVVERARRRVLVRHLDLSTEPPPRLEYNLILCRNVVIYFDRAVQERVFQIFAGALAPGGFLVLGKVETLFGPARDRLTLVDPRERIYRRPSS
jgi:chemotaxis methyl-accepting protein methylase